MPVNENWTTEETLPRELTKLLTLATKVASLSYYRHILGSLTDKEQTIWLLALEVYAELEPAELQLALAQTNNRKLWRLLDGKIQRECVNNGYRKFHHKEVSYTSAWLPEAVTFTDYLALVGEIDQLDDSLATTIFPIAESKDWDWQELQQTQEVAPARPPANLSISSPSPLTPREYEVMIVFLIPNTKRKEAAQYLNISLHTLKAHLDTAYKKFNVHTLKEARRKFIEVYKLDELVADY